MAARSGSGPAIGGCMVFSVSQSWPPPIRCCHVRWRKEETGHGNRHRGLLQRAGEEIARGISTENPSSCQIAQRRRITRAMVDRMGEAGFGAEIHGRRESLSEMSLRGQAADLLSRGASGNEISRIPGPARSTCHRLMGEAHPQEPLSRRQRGAWQRPWPIMPRRPCHYTLSCSSTPPLRSFAFILQILLQKAMPMAVTVSTSVESMNFCA